GRSVTFTNISLRDGVASFGGVLYIPTGSRVLLYDSDVRQGVATVVGGGVRLFRGTLVLSGTSRIYNNEALGGNGGGIAAQLGTIVLQDESQVGTEVLGNVAVNGGGIYMVTSWLTMTAESGIVGNEATENGGGLYGATGSQIYVAGRIEGNGATGVVGRGGGVYLLPDSGTPISMIVSAGVIVSNTAGFGGGGVAVVADNSQANIRLNQSDLISNTALLGGGAWLMDADSTLVMAGNSKVSYNRATSGNGGGVFLGGGALTFGGQVVNNEASSNGGGIFNSGGVVTIGEFSSLNGNWAGNDGGGIYDSSGNVLLLDGVDSYAEILWNRADNDGGGVYMNGGDLQVHGYVLIGSNRASSNGGGVYQVGGVGDWEAVDDEQRPLLIGNWTETGNGGGLYTINMTDTTNYLSGVVIRHNEAGRSGSGLGGGIYGQESIYKVAYTQLISNVATYGGGGMALEVSSWVEFRSTSNGNVCSPLALPRNEHCSMFKDNRADQVGGAVFVDRESSFTSSQVGFRDNRAGIGAVAASWIYGQNVLGFTNALMMNNVAWSPSYSDVIRFAGDTGILALRHTTIAGNGSPAVRVDLAGPSVQIDNSIVWDNVDGVLVAGTLSSPTCNIVQNGVGGTVINPSFVSRWYGDYQLGVGSPALDVCVNEGTFVDLLGMPRPQAGGYDMGAFERCDTTITAVGLVGNDVVIDWVEDELVYAVYHSSVSPYLGMTALGFDEAPPYTDVGRLSGGAEGHYYYVDGLNCYRSQYFGTFSFEVTAGS
ncbi:MAG TPA: choice-of-anchor Q domain-containing protein, partial [Anaerolineae bacterium]|nr:choice-of-anchor Q domain-containing protein [Anaerolineae bacterium]